MGIRILKLFKHSEVKNLVSNFLWLSILQVVNYMLPLITLPYLARTIGVTGFGKVSFAAAVILWFQTVCDWGFNFTATRDIARVKNNSDKVSRIFSRVLMARLGLLFISLAVLTLLIFSIRSFYESRLVLYVTFLLIPGHILCPDWFFQAMEKMKYITILNVIAKIVFTIAVFLFIKSESDYFLQPLFISLGYLMSGFIAGYIILKKMKIRIVRVSFKAIFITIKKSTDVFINALVPNLYNSFSVVLMGFWGGPVANGKFDAGSKFPSVLMQIVNIISRTFFPFLSRKIEHHKKFVIINVTITSVFSIILFFLAPLLIHLFFTPQFDDAIIVTQILCVSLPFYALSNAYGVNYLILIGKEHLLRNITVISSIISMGIAVIMVYYYTYIGAAITITVARILIGVCSMFFATRIK